MKKQKVSIVMPIYNVEKYLDECMKSVLNQTLNNIEIICVDDGSTDGSAAILDRYASGDVRVKVIHKQNEGYGKAMNLGFSLAQGEYIGVVETDDFVSPEMMEELYNRAKKDDLDIVKGDYYIFKTVEGRYDLQYVNILDSPRLYHGVFNPKKDKEVFRARMNTWAGIYRRQFLVEREILHNETPGASYQDNGFWFQTFTQAERIGFIEKPLYYLRRDNPNSSVNSREKVYCICDEMNFIRPFMDRKPEIYCNFKDIFWESCFRKYIFNLKRIAPLYKLEFIRYMHDEFISHIEEIDLSLFNENQMRYFSSILQDPDTFYYDYVKIPENVERFCRQDKNLILFGRGKIVDKVLRKCRFNNIEICKIANLNQNSNGKVVNIETIKEEAANTAVLVVDEEKNVEKNRKILEQLGFTDYLFYEDE